MQQRLSEQRVRKIIQFFANRFLKDQSHALDEKRTDERFIHDTPLHFLRIKLFLNGRKNSCNH